MTLYDEIEKIWDNKDQLRWIEEKTNEWVTRIVECRGRIDQAAHKFRVLPPLMTYTSVSRMKARGDVVFSLRYRGRQVGQIVVREADGAVRLRVREEAHRFGAPLAAKDYPWSDRDRRVRRFKRYFQTHGKQNDGEHWLENRVESLLIALMRGLRPKGEAKQLRNFTPVLVGNRPLQVPVPVQANTGIPKFPENGRGYGHIDILARTRRGIAIWELKRSGELKTARPVNQAYIYAVTLLKILRSAHGGLWYSFIFPDRREAPLPKSITVDAIAAVSIDQKEELADQFDRFRHAMPSSVGDDKVKLWASYYHMTSGRLSVSNPEALQ